MQHIARPFRTLLVPMSLATLVACNTSDGGTDPAAGSAIVSLAVSGDPSLPRGTIVRWAATATRADGGSADVTDAVTWTSSDATVARVSTAAGTAGYVTAVSPGRATLRAEAPGGIAATREVQVTDASLVALSVASPAPLPAGTTAQLAATGTFTDASEHDLTLVAAWSSDTPGIADVSSQDPTRGVVSAVAPGQAVITADAGGVAATTSVTVTDAKLVLVELAPLDPSIVVGGTVALAVTGTYTDDSTADLAATTDFATSDAQVATVSPAGVVLALTPGTAVITGTERGSGLSGQTTVTVLAASVPMQLSYVTLGRGSVAGGTAVTGTVVLTRATGEAVTVALASSSAYATVPASVVVPAGQDRATFTVQTTRPTNRRKVKVVVSATLGGITKSASLNVRATGTSSTAR